jgi:RNA polymerase sigma-70 factor, ECF subfamily
MITRREAEVDERLSGERAKLLALARALVHDPAEADDVVHEVLVAALDRDEPLREPGPWLRQVLRNEVRGRARKRARREARAVALVEPPAVTVHEETAARREVAQVLWHALGQLEEPYREVLRRRFLCEESPTDIAGSSGDPPSTVRWRIHEGIRRLRRSLDDRFGGRAQWCSGFAVVVGLPTTVPVKGLVGSMSTAFKSALVIAATGVLPTCCSRRRRW